MTVRLAPVLAIVANGQVMRCDEEKDGLGVLISWHESEEILRWEVGIVQLAGRFTCHVTQNRHRCTWSAERHQETASVIDGPHAMIRTARSEAAARLR